MSLTNCPWCNRRVLPDDLRPRDSARPAVGCTFCIDWRVRALMDDDLHPTQQTTQTKGKTQ